jgi:hypothetical protein
MTDFTNDTTLQLSASGQIVVNGDLHGQQLPSERKAILREIERRDRANMRRQHTRKEFRIGAEGTHDSFAQTMAMFEQ